MTSAFDTLESDLRTAVDHCEGIEFVPWNPGEQLPGCVMPGQVIRFFEKARKGDRDDFGAWVDIHVDRQICSASAVYGIGQSLVQSVRRLVDDFRLEVKVRKIDLRWARPLPHVPQGFAAYLPVRVDGAPCRLIASWSYFHGGWYLTLDTILHDAPPEGYEAPSWRDREGLL